MNLVVIAAFIAVCGAAKLDRTYLPPSSAATAGGSPGSLQAPLTRTSEQGLETPSLPTGSYTNNFGGVVVDAASPGTRASADADLSGLGGPRPSYGSSNSKVGDAAFRGSLAGFRNTPSFVAGSGQIGTHGQGTSASNGQFEHHAEQSLSSDQIDTHAGKFSSNGQVEHRQIGQAGQGFSSNGQAAIKTGQSFLGFDENKSERPQAAKDRNSNILTLSNDVNSDSYSYGFETDNGIAVGENGVAVNGVQAEGGYSYQGDDGQVYKVTYTADEGGYRPQGAHLPTPPPIPEEILKSLEQNAKEEAAGLVDDGSYDAQKYNADGDYTHDNGGNIQYNGAQLSQFGKRPESDATASGTFINQNNQALGKPVLGQFGTGSDKQNANLAFNGQSNQVNGNSASGQFGAASSAQNSFTGQSSQVNRNPGSGQFGSASQNGYSSYSGQSSQENVKPGSGQFGSQSTFNGQTSQSGQLGITGSQNSHSTFEQSSQGNGNHYNSNQNGETQVSHSNQPQSGHEESSVAEQNFEQNTGNQFSSQGGFGNQAQIASQISQQPSASQFGNQSPESGSQQFQQGFTAQFGSNPSTPSFGQGAIENSDSSHPQFGSSFKPQGSEAFSGASLNKDQDTQDFGKPSPTFSGQNFNRLSAGNVNSNKPTPGQTQVSKFGSAASFNRFPQASGQFGANNEYLPPLNTNSQSQTKIPEVSAPGFNVNGQKPGKKEQILTMNAQNHSFASASTSSFGQPAFQPQSVKPLNAFNTQSQSKPNKFTQQQYTQQNSQFSSQTPAQFNSNSKPELFGSSADQGVPNFGSKPTVVPATELTTPLEPTDIPASSPGSQFSSQTPTSFGSFDSKPESNNQGQTQFGSQGISAFGQQSTSQTLSPSFPTSSPQSTNMQFGTASTQSAFSSSVDKRPENSNDKPQFLQNTFDQNQQPSFNQAVDNSYYYNQPAKPFGTPAVRPQGSRFPSSPSYQSNGVASQNQNQQNSFQSSTKFPGSLSLAPVAPTSATQFAQTQGYSGITQAAISSFPSASPTLSSQFGTTQNGQFESKPTFTQQSNFGSQAQISGTSPSFNQQSAFSSQQNKPTFSQQAIGQPAFPSRPISQFVQNPTPSGSQTQTQFGQTENTPGSSDVLSQQQTTMTQQYEGTIYEYNKPAEVLPAPSQTDNSSSQTIQAGVTSDSNPSFGQPQVNQFSSQQKPLSQAIDAGSKLDAQNNKPFGLTPSTTQFGQHSQTVIGNQTPQQTEVQFGSQSAKPFNAPSLTNGQFGQSGQFGTQPAKPFGASSVSTQFHQTSHLTPDSLSSMKQSTQGSQQTLKPFGASNQGAQASFGSKPQFASQTTQFSQGTQSFVNSQNSQPAGENAASGQNSGYFYQGNPEPQFQINSFSKNQFGQNSQSARPQSGLNQFNQYSQNYQNHFGEISQPGNSATGTFNQQTSQSQFNTASKPHLSPQSTQYTQNTQAQFGQNTPNFPSQSFVNTQFGQSTASSKAVASGQATASASASSAPQQTQYNHFGSHDKNQFGQTQKPTDSHDQNGQGTQQFGAQNIKPFGSNTQEPSKDSSKPYGALNSKPFAAEVPKPLFNSPCCQGSKDSIPAQSTDRPSQASFQGTQSFNAQSFAGKGEEFGGPRQPARYDDQTGYHY